MKPVDKSEHVKAHDGWQVRSGTYGKLGKFTKDLMKRARRRFFKKIKEHEHE